MWRLCRSLDGCDSDGKALNEILSTGVQQVRVVWRAVALAHLVKAGSRAVWWD